MALSESRRQQLDGVIQQMIENKESEDDIRFVVSDFKRIYEGESLEEPKKGILEKIGSIPKMNPAQAFGQTLIGGAKDIGGVAARATYEIGKLGAATLGKIPKALTGTKEELPESYEQFIEGVSPGATDILKPKGAFQKTGALGTQIATWVAPTKRILGAQTFLKGVAENLPKGLKTAGKVGAVAAPEAGAALAVSKAQGASKEETDRNILLAAGIPLAFRAAGGALQFTKEQAPRIINSLIKPLKKDFSYGKDPGRAVSEEGIVGNSLDEIADNIKARKEEYGAKISTAVEASTKTGVILDVSGAMKALDDAEAAALKAPRTNATLLSRLQDARKDLLKVTTNDAGQEVAGINLSALTPDEAWKFKQIIGDITKWTGNASDDKLVNSALQNVYRNVKNILNDAIPGLKGFNERYADLLSAEIATRYRNKIAERLNILPLGARITGYGSAIIGALTTGNISPLLVGLSAGAADIALSSPAVKSRVAAWLAKTPKAEREQLLNKVPILKSSIERIFGPGKQQKGGTPNPKGQGAIPKTIPVAPSRPAVHPDISASNLSQGAKAGLSRMYNESPQAKEYIDGLADSISSKYQGSRVAKVKIKEPVRAVKKILRDYGGDHTKVSDLARNTIIVRKFHELESVMSDIASTGNTIKHKLSQKYQDPLGYVGGNTKIADPATGHIAEIQSNIPEMIFAKESEKDARSILGNGLYDEIADKVKIQGGQGHIFYERWQKAIENSDIQLADTLAEESTKYYKQFYPFF